MLRNVMIVLGQTGSAAGIQVDQTFCQRALTDVLYEPFMPAGKIMAFNNNTRDECVLIP